MTTEVGTFDDWQVQYDAKMANAVTNLDPRWGVKAYRAHRTRDGVAYVFTLTFDGTPAASVEDSGQGGGPSIWWHEVRGAASAAFASEAERLFDASPLGAEDMVEAIIQKAGK